MNLLLPRILAGLLAAGTVSAQSAPLDEAAPPADSAEFSDDVAPAADAPLAEPADGPAEAVAEEAAEEAAPVVEPEPAPAEESSEETAEEVAEVPDCAPGVAEAISAASGILGKRFADLSDDDLREAVMMGILRAADPGLRVLSRGEWEAERDSAELALADAVATEDFPAHIGYAKVSALVPGSGRVLADAFRRWDDEAFHGVILDLRGAAGSDENSVFPVASLFPPPSGARDDRLVFSVSGPQGDVRHDRSSTFRFSFASYPIPVMVLVDESTRGAAELLAAVLKGSCKGTLLVGETTAADPGVRLPRDLPGDRVALVALRKFAVASGAEYDGTVGVVPDILLAPADRVVEVAESNNPISMRRVKRGELEEEREDRALRDRIGSDGCLIRAVDILQGLRAIAP